MTKKNDHFRITDRLFVVLPLFGTDNLGYTETNLRHTTTGGSDMSEKIIWNPTFETGHDTIDAQHQHLVAIINALTESIGQSSKETLVGSIAELKAYAEYHFQAEEGVMEAALSPHLSAHRAEHQSFIDQIELFDLDVILASEGLAADMLYFLRSWLTHHILQEDKKFMADIRPNPPLA